jgi:hypothetical protein
VNLLHSHWLRMSFWLFIASPLVALAITLTTDAPFTLALALTLYMWAFICAILALIALVGVALRLIGWGMRALRR